MHLVQYLHTVDMEKLGKTLGVSYATVHKWRVLAQAPRADIAYKLIHVSQGALSFETIFMPYVERKLKLTKKKTKTGVQLEFPFTRSK